MSNRLTHFRHAAFGIGAVATFAAPLPANAQAGAVPVVSQPVVQPIPGETTLRFNDALARVGQNPSDPQALIAAGQAALAVGDADAAVGFFQRADALAPGNPQAKAGLAGAFVRKNDPVAAIPLYLAAEAAGPLDAGFAGDRGLAYDLVGDNATAQRYYAAALSAGADDETVRRLALSLAIAGDKAGMERTLTPLLQKQDKAAWRTRAFALAILGQTADAEAITRQSMPAELASGMVPYLRYLPRLTAAQQAAAGNFGIFPRAADIGRDDPRFAAYAPVRKPVRTADAALVPAGQPLGKPVVRKGKVPAKPRAVDEKPVQVAASAAAPTAPQPGREVSEAPAQIAAATPPPRSAPPSRVATPAVEKQASASQGFDLAKIQPQPAPATANKAPAVPPAPAPVPASQAPAAPARASLSEAFAEFSAPSRSAAPASGAVDIRKITPASEVSAAEPKPKQAKPAPPRNPSRIWVQVATGRNKQALAFDWRKMSKESAAVFRRQKPYTAAWGRTNRLLTGPFDSEEDAKAYMAQLRKAGVDGSFIWTSPAGSAVDALPVK